MEKCSGTKNGDGKVSFALSLWTCLGISGSHATLLQLEFCRATSQILWVELGPPEAHMVKSYTREYRMLSDAEAGLLKMYSAKVRSDQRKATNTVQRDWCSCRAEI